MAEEDLEEQFHDAVTSMDVVSHEMKPPEAWDVFGEVTLEDFWRTWPQLRGWAEWLWRLIDAERGEKATPAEESPHEEIGGSG